jgi:hypothetical protein
VVEAPVSAYLQWELHLLRLMGSISDWIRVVDSAQIRDLETGSPLPEVVTLGDDLTFEVLYGADGVLSGAVCHVGTAITKACRDAIAGLYASGEDVVAYVDREIAVLPPPVPQQQSGQSGWH